MARKKKPVNNLHSKFYATISGSHFRAEPHGGRHTRTGNRERTDYNINMAEAQELAMKNPSAAARELAKLKTMVQREIPSGTPGPAAAELSEEYRRPRISNQDINIINRAQREQTWHSKPNIYRVPPKEKRTPGGFLREEAAKSHRNWVEQQMQDRNSEFNQDLDLTRARTGKYTSAQNRRLSIYTDALQEGASHQEALQKVRASRLREGVGRPAERGRSLVSTRQSQAQSVVTARSQARGRASKYASVAPQPGEMRVGISGTKPPTISEIKKSFPNLSEQELIQIRQAGLENITQELLTNQKWAHETRRANLLGKKNKTGIEQSPDKVTIFTTNLGHPSISLPAGSLVGQYIIKKRKAIASGFGVPSSRLRGHFPAAVQDAHIVDIATGASLGLQGRQGVFNTTGWRVGKKASQGYGRTRPLGAQVLYDTTTGRPLYDSEGNIRYSEGATRPVDWTTPSLGFRVLMG